MGACGMVGVWYMQDTKIRCGVVSAVGSQRLRCG